MNAGRERRKPGGCNSRASGRGAGGAGVAWFAMLVCVALFPPVARAQDGVAVLAALEKTVADLVAKNERTVVSIARVRNVRHVLPPEPLDPFRLPRNPGIPRGADDPRHPDFVPNEFGAGVVFVPPGRPRARLILTAHHVVRGGPPVGTEWGRAESRLFVRFSNRYGCDASVVASDPHSDLAVLEPDFREAPFDPADLPAVTLVPGRPLRKGQFVLAFGNPYAIARDGSASVSWGLVANRARRMVPAAAAIDEDFLKQETIHHYGTLLQVDSRLNLGTSGGPVFDLQGRFSGITLATSGLEGYEKSAGYAIPFDDSTVRIVQDLAQGYEVEYGFLGIEPRYLPSAELRRFAGTFEQPSAALVFQVYANSPAATGTPSTGGLLPGDVVLDVGGVPVLDQMDLMREVALLGPGATARMRVWRERQKRETTVEAVLGKWPVRDDEGIVATRTRFPPWKGLAVDFPTARRKFVTFPFQYRQAVVVMRSDPQAEWSRDLVPGSFVTHVNDKPVRTPAEFQDAVKKATGKVRLQIENRPEPVEVP